jgi:hypothetical protein
LGIPYGYNSHRSRLGRDNRPKLFRKTNISNDVAGALHPIVGRSGPDTVGLFTFLTLSDFQSFAKLSCSCRTKYPWSLSGDIGGDTRKPISGPEGSNKGNTHVTLGRDNPAPEP